jgi:2-polyprenyl-6-methoxyphenol hydroxylase-like FAD-dependent oxidoreductase
MQSTDVLIIGAGPTGTTLALELALQNIPFRILDSAPTRTTQSRALVIQPRTLELLARHSITRDLLAHGNVGAGARVFVNKNLTAELDLGDLGFDDTAFPLPLWISQADTEQCLDAALRSRGHVVERPFTAKKIEQDDTGVTVVLRNGNDGSEERLRAKYVVGCDGAHSVVRHAAELKFEGSAYPQDFLLADLHLDWSLRAEGDNRLIMFFGQGMLVVFPLQDGLFRLVVSTTGRKLTAGEDAEPTLEDFRRVWSEMAPGEAVLRDPVWITRFRLHHRGVDSYRKGRLFVAGDAAHIHSPAGGQGMNTGMQDAVNLGWKLASVLRGERDEKLLDSYDIERRRVGEHLLKGTDRAFQFGSSGNPVFIFLRNFLVPWVLPWAFGDRGRRARMFRFMSELGIRYRHSPVVGTASNYNGPLRGGDRAPDATLKDSDGSTSMLGLCTGPSHHLIMFSGTGSAAADDTALQSHADRFTKASANLAKIHKVFTQKCLGSSGYLDDEGQLHARYGFVAPGYALIRPDGYVAHIGPLSAMDEFLEWLKGYTTPPL